MNDETWDPAWGAGNSAFQTAAKDLAAHRVRPFAALRACPEWNEGVTMLGHLGCCLLDTRQGRPYISFAPPVALEGYAIMVL